MHSERRPPIATRDLVLRLIRAYRTLSRVELAAATGFTVAAMTNIVRGLLVDGFIEEAGSSGNTGGKPRTLLRIRGDSGYAIGVSVDLHHVRFALLDFAGRVIGTMPAAGPSGSVEELTSTIANGARELAAHHSLDEARLLGVGIAGPGPHDRSASERAPGPYADQWIDDSVQSAVADRLSMPVLLLNDANAVALGEFALSIDARSSGNFACVYLGESGLGSGIFVDGQLVLGSNSFAGAIAHVSMNVEGPACFCGSRGCLELYGSPRAVIAAVRDHDRLAGGPPVGVSRGGPILPSDMGRLYSGVKAGHDYATGHVQMVADYIASAAATMATILDLDLIILSGETFSGLESVYMEALEGIVDRIGRAGARRTFAVRPSTLGHGNLSSAVGGALAILEQSPQRAEPTQ